MINKLKNHLYPLLRWSEKYTKTDIIYLIKGSFWLNSNIVVTTFFSFFLYIAFARLLPKEDYGIYQFILSAGSLLGALTLTGMNSAITQAVARNYEGTFKKSVRIQLKWGLITFSVATITALYYFLNQNNTIAIGILIAGICIPILNSFNTYNAFLSGKKDFRMTFFLAQILNFSYYPILILSLFFVKNPTVLIFINLLINVIVSIISYCITLKIYPPNKNEDPTTISYGKHLSLASILNTLILQLDNILVFHYLGAVNLAIYAFSTNIPERVYSLTKSVQAVALPKLSVQSRENLQKNILTKSTKFAAISLFIAIFYIVLAPYIFKFLFPQYVSSIFYSQIYMAMLVIVSFSIIPVTSLTAIKAKKEIYLYNIIGPILTIIIMFFMIKNYGLLGLILARGISGIFNYFLSSLLLSKNKEDK